jgi:hypothetical protein
MCIFRRKPRTPKSRYLQSDTERLLDSNQQPDLDSERRPRTRSDTPHRRMTSRAKMQEELDRASAAAFTRERGELLHGNVGSGKIAVEQ